MDLTRWQPRCVGDIPPAQVEFKRCGVASRLDVADVRNVAFETVDRVREPGSWKHKVNYTGFYWAATTGGHVWFESLYEMAALMRLDRDPTVLAISAQPMRIHWAMPRGQGDVQDHTPDFLVRWRDGTAALVDVKPARNIQPKDIVAFDRTLSLCSELGWDYFVVDDISEAEAHNLRFLSGYRYARWHDETCVELLHEQAGRAARLSAWEELLRNACPEPLGAVYSALWWRELESEGAQGRRRAHLRATGNLGLVPHQPEPAQRSHSPAGLVRPRHGCAMECRRRPRRATTRLRRAGDPSRR